MSSQEIITLKEYIKDLLAEKEKNLDHRFNAIAVAIQKADAYSEYRDKKQNEFRDALDDQNKTFARQSDVAALEKRLDEVRDDVEKIKYLKQGGVNSWVIIVAGIMIVFSFIGLALKYLL